MILLMKVTFLREINCIRLIFESKVHLIQKVIFYAFGVGKLSDSQLFLQVDSWEERFWDGQIMIVEHVSLILDVREHNMLTTKHEEESHTDDTENQIELGLSILFIFIHLFHFFIPILNLLNFPLFLLSHFLLFLFIFFTFDFGSFFVGVTQNVIERSHILTEYHVDCGLISDNFWRLQRKQLIKYILIWQQNLFLHIWQENGVLRQTEVVCNTDFDFAKRVIWLLQDENSLLVRVYHSILSVITWYKSIEVTIEQPIADHINLILNQVIDL